MVWVSPIDTPLREISYEHGQVYDDNAPLATESPPEREIGEFGRLAPTLP